MQYLDTKLKYWSHYPKIDEYNYHHYRTLAHSKLLPFHRGATKHWTLHPKQSLQGSELPRCRNIHRLRRTRFIYSKAHLMFWRVDRGRIQTQPRLARITSGSARTPAGRLRAEPSRAESSRASVWNKYENLFQRIMISNHHPQGGWRKNMSAATHTFE